ncbi:MAG TPA: ATP-binding protein [Chitinophagaceae bacterium]|jgi:signal transduction histidine kinase|nr:ATP-binding protein [Chitinophagaceae bacterium]
MKDIFFLVFLFIAAIKLPGQSTEADSLIKLLEKAPGDTNRVKLILNLANKLYFYKPDLSLEYSENALKLARDLKYNNGIVNSLNLAGEARRLTGDYPKALQYQLEALEISRELKNEFIESNSLGFIGVIYMELNEYRQALQYFLPAFDIKNHLPASPPGVFILANTGISYDFLNMPDSALHYLKLAEKQNIEVRHPQLSSLIPRSVGNVYMHKGKLDSALLFYFAALQNSRSSNESINLGAIQQKIAEAYEKLNLNDSSLYYGLNAFNEAQRTSQKSRLLESSNLLVRLYRRMHKYDSAFYYNDLATSMKDSLYGMPKFKQLQLLMLSEQKRQQEIEQEQERYQNEMRMIALWSAVGVFLVIAFILFRNNRQKQKTNRVLETTLSNLRLTQTQLIQSEKMASLGELTAGIAHEIQNPLNFVNNFSEVNDELLKELKTEAEKGNLEEVKAIANDILFNSEKINRHGKRADAIVKGMLQHSRSSSGKKEPTDINALADEYLRLAYHGLRAKDKSFNVTTKTDFDPGIGKINIIPQDIGRVILNLINNAFYAVDEKKKSPHILKEGEEYEPAVTVATKRLGSPPSGGDGGKPDSYRVEIRVADNGNGIPEKILDKVFQPFFTTKPTGQGTGLGLSMAYDIVKAHGGELKVETNEGDGSEFIVRLPGS